MLQVSCVGARDLALASIRPHHHSPLASVTNIKRRLGVRAAAGYNRIYDAVCGRHPALRPWHFQWLAGRPLYGVLAPTLGSLTGNVLDVGCGEKPYAAWAVRASDYFGIDVAPGPRVDAVIEAGAPWPIAGRTFDAVVCTQVLEHVSDLADARDELVRAIRPGGLAVVSVPFLYHEHGAPHDYRRFSRHGAAELLGNRLELVSVTAVGGIGSTLAALLLAWIESSLTARGAGLVALTALFPVWLAMCLMVNGLGLVLDRLDRTGRFYAEVVVVARKPIVER